MLLLLWILAATVMGAQANLFSSYPSAISVLTPKDFDNNKLVNSQQTIVNFHSSSCGHCIAQAPIYVEFAALVLHDDNTVQVAALDCDEHRDICSRFHIRGTPTFKLFRDGDVLEQANAVGGSLVALVSAANEYFHTTLAATRPTTQQMLAVKSTAKLHKLPRLRQVERKVFEPKQRVLHDAELSIRYSLEKGVFLGRFELEPTEYRALVNWLDVLQQLFPSAIGRWKLSSLRKRVIGFHKQHGKLTSEAFDGMLLNWSFPLSSNNEKYEWQHCNVRGEKNDGAGYTCGLWLLFHSLGAASAQSLALQKQVSFAMHDFITHFFSCQDCRDNFLLHNPTAFVPQPGNGFPMWLWREHNYVNKRLNLENKNEQHYDGFPAREICPTCYVSTATDRFNETVVEKYLHYAFSGFQSSEAIPWTTEEEEDNIIIDAQQHISVFHIMALGLFSAAAVICIFLLRQNSTKSKRMNV